ncbi:hypothetical protein ACE6H2_023235 [Prunus campanulata]
MYEYAMLQDAKSNCWMRLPKKIVAGDHKIAAGVMYKQNRAMRENRRHKMILDDANVVADIHADANLAYEPRNVYIRQIFLIIEFDMIPIGVGRQNLEVDP